MVEGYKSTVEECANTGNISGNRVGGITSLSSGNILNCYNTGRVTEREQVVGYDVCAGGIVGIQRLYQLPNTNDFRAGKVQNCYNTGVVEGKNSAALTKGLYNSADGAEIYGTIKAGVFQAYALEGTGENLILTASEYVTKKDLNKAVFCSEEKLKSDDMVLDLGSAYRKDSENINGGYPVLEWQGGSSVEPSSVTLGDVNNDQKINMSDSLLVCRAVAGTAELTEPQTKAADVNGDGKLNMSDALIIIRYVSGAITDFPANSH